MDTDSKLFRILSIDGGGIRGIIPGQVLTVLEKKIRTKTNNPDAKIAEYFDMIAGTSTGGILTCLYLTPDENQKPKYSAEQAVDLYLNHGSEIFDISLWHKIESGAGLTDEKYSATKLEAALKDYLGDIKLNELLKPCLITSYDIFNRQAKFFNQLDAKQHSMNNFYVREVARATSAAPTYFECARITSMTDIPYTMVDGGVFANNPTLCAYAEARNKIQARAADMAILSLGTGYVETPYSYKNAKDWGLIQWVKPILDIMMSGVSETVDYQLIQMFDAVERPNQYLRINTELKLSSTAMDNASKENLLALKEEGEILAETFDQKLNTFVDLLINN